MSDDDYFEQEARRCIEAYGAILDEQNGMLSIRQAAALLLTRSPDKPSMMLADIDDRFRELMRDLRDQLMPERANPHQPWDSATLAVVDVVTWGRANNYAHMNYIYELLGRYAENVGSSYVRPEELAQFPAVRLLGELYGEFWKNKYDPKRPETIPKKDTMTVPWLVSRGVSRRVAEAMDSMLRDSTTSVGGNRKRKGVDHK